MFNLAIPTSIKGVDPKVLDPVGTWDDKEEFNKMVNKLAHGFKKNFERYAKNTGQEVINAGPQI